MAEVDDPSAALALAGRSHDVGHAIRACQEFRARLLGADPSPRGRYRLGRMLGAGGLGVVFEAFDTELERRVAIKLLRAGNLSTVDGLRALRREARVLAQLCNPRVVTVYDIGTIDADLAAAVPHGCVECDIFLVMELIDAEPWSRREHQAWEEIETIFRKIADGLDDAHAAGVIHGDIKPGNVLVSADGEPTIVDFGLGRCAQARWATISQRGITPAEPGALTPTSVGGTPAFMAPELLAGEPATEATDLYAACVTLFALVYRRLPFKQPHLLALLRAKESEQIDWSSPYLKIPRRATEAIARGLRADPRRRFGSMRALVKAMRPPPRRTALRRTLFGGALFVAAALGVSGGRTAPAAEATSSLGAPLHRMASNGRTIATVFDNCAQRIEGISAAYHETGALGLNAAAAHLALLIGETYYHCDTDVANADHWLREAQAQLQRGAPFETAELRARELEARVRKEPVAVLESVLERRLDALSNRAEVAHQRDEWAHVASSLAELLATQRKNDRALSLAQRALCAMLEDWGPVDRRTALMRTRLASAHTSRFEYALARAEEEQALAVNQDVLGPLHPVTLRGRANLAALLFVAGEEEQGLRMLDELRAPAQQVYGVDHPLTVGVAVNSALLRVVTAEREGRVDLAQIAEDIVRRALVSDEVADSIQSRRVARRLEALAISLIAQGRSTEAIDVLGRALEGLARADAGGDAFMGARQTRAGILERQAQALMLVGEAARAVTLLDQALAEDDASDMDRADGLKSLPLALARSGDVERARDVLRESGLAADGRRRQRVAAAIASAEGRHRDAAANYKALLRTHVGFPMWRAEDLAFAARAAEHLGRRRAAARLRAEAARLCTRVQVPNAETCAYLSRASRP